VVGCRGMGHNRVAVGLVFLGDPGLSSFLGQPWASGHNAFGVRRGRGRMLPPPWGQWVNPFDMIVGLHLFGFIPWDAPMWIDRRSLAACG
jgi:hypothetical protein